MTIQEAERETAALHGKAASDGDTLVTVYLSRSDDKYLGRTTNMDAGDALMVINHLIDDFKLSREAIANM